MAELRERELYKPPGVAETIDWAQALRASGRSSLDDASVDATLGSVVKYREDLERVRHGRRRRPGQGGRGPCPLTATSVGRRRTRSPACVRLPAPDEDDGDLGVDAPVAFARALRRVGLDVTVDAAATFAEGLTLVGPLDRDAVYWTGRSTLVRRPQDLAVYDLAFAAFSDRVRIEAEPDTVPEPIVLALDDDDDDTDDEDGERPDTDPVTVRFSRVETLRQQGLRRLHRRRAGRAAPGDRPPAGERAVAPVASLPPEPVGHRSTRPAGHPARRHPPRRRPDRPAVA